MQYNIVCVILIYLNSLKSKRQGSFLSVGGTTELLPPALNWPNLVNKALFCHGLLILIGSIRNRINLIRLTANYHTRKLTKMKKTNYQSCTWNVRTILTSLKVDFKDINDVKKTEIIHDELLKLDIAILQKTP